MKKVTVENLKSFEYEIPSDWTDFSTKELIRVHELVQMYERKSTEGIRLILYCFGLRGKKQILSKRAQNIIELPGAWLHTLLKDGAFLGWIFKPNGIESYPLKKFRHNHLLFIGPARSCLDIATIELVAAYTRFFYFAQTKKTVHLDYLAALLYRPARPFYLIERLHSSYNRDIRVKLNPYHLEKRAKSFETLPIGIKMVILRQFSSEFAKFQKKYKNVFSGNGVGKYDPDNWIKILIQLSGGAFGTLEQIKLHNAEEVFKKIEMDMLTKINSKIK